MKTKLIRVLFSFALMFFLESFMALNGFCTDKIQKSKLEGKYEQMETIDILAICVEAEAGNQDQYGKRLVADVILNRVDSDRFPDDIEGVISQKYHFSTY